MLFATFDEAWRWFCGGGSLIRAGERTEEITAGRAQMLGFGAPVTDGAVLDAIDGVLDSLSDVQGLEPVPAGRLHISIRGVGFQVIEKRRPDDVLRQEVLAIGEHAARVLRGIPAVEARIGPVNVFPDALILEVHDGGALARIRGSLAGTGGASDPLRLGDMYLPHVTIAVFAAPDAAAPLRERLPPLRDAASVATTLRRVELVRAWFTGAGDDPPDVEVEPLRSYALR